MDYHHHARLTVHGREQMCRSVLEARLGLCAAAAAHKLSRQGAAKWVRRYREQGLAGLRDRSSRPHRCPRQIAEPVVERVIELRRTRLTGFWIARQTGVSVATVSRILRRARLSRWRDLVPRPPVARYEHEQPGDLLHLDIKGLTRFGEVSQRGDGRLRGKRKHPGFCALHIAIVLSLP